MILIYTLIEISGELLNSFLIFFYFYNLFHKKVSWRVLIASCLGFCGACCLLGTFFAHPTVRVLFLFISAVTIAFILFDADHIGGVFSAVLLCALVIIADLLCVNFVTLLGWNMQVIRETNLYYSFYILFTKIVFFIAVFATTKLFHHRIVVANPSDMLWLLPCLLLCILFCSKIRSTAARDELSLHTFELLVGISCAMLTIVIAADLARLLAESRYKEKLALQQYNMKKQYYEDLHQTQEAIRALQHDMDKYLLAMETVKSSEENAAFTQELAALRETFRKTISIVHTNNHVLNTILNHYVHKANNAHIQVDTEIWVSDQFNVSAVDLSVVIGNTFDNAIEACNALPEGQRRISLTIRQQYALLFYELRNSCNRDTQKKKKIVYGYGLQNIQRAIDIYYGQMQCNCKNGTFQVSVLFSIPDEMPPG